MFGFFKRKNKHDPEQAPQQEQPQLEEQPQDTSVNEPGIEVSEKPGDAALETEALLEPTPEPANITEPVVEPEPGPEPII
ncbi:MAG: signal recognition particle-docking protein FtsY, partial [Halomonadaceae bacterium]